MALIRLSGAAHGAAPVAAAPCFGQRDLVLTAGSPVHPTGQWKMGILVMVAIQHLLVVA